MAAHNIVARIKREQPSPLPLLDIQTICLTDAGDTGIFFIVDRLPKKTRRRSIVMSGATMHLGKFLFEKCFM